VKINAGACLKQDAQEGTSKGGRRCVSKAVFSDNPLLHETLPIPRLLTHNYASWLH